MDLSTIVGFIVFLGSPAALNWIISNFLDKLPAGSWWAKLTDTQKAAAEFVIGLVLSAASWALIHFVTPDFWARYQPEFAVIFAFISAWIGGQIQHTLFLKAQFVKDERKNSLALYHAQIAEVNARLAQIKPAA